MSALLDIRGLKVRYGEIEAVRQLDLQVEHGETVALAGESGCGKSTSVLAVMGLLSAEAEISGEALFEGRDLLTLGPKALRRLRGGSISMVFQDSMAALNPVLTIGAQIGETLRIHDGLMGRAARARAAELLSLVEIADPDKRLDDYPHQFSGGQRQRAAIAMAVASRPKLLIADEPTTALDAAVQARTLELLDRLKREFGMGLLLITHDLGLVGQWADRTAVMLRGLKVEDGPTRTVLTRPRHPYTRLLLGAAQGLEAGRHYTRGRLPEAGAGVLVSLRPPAPAVEPPLAAEPRGALLSVRDLHVRYAGKQGAVEAVNGVSFDIAPGETVGLVGESGCGKSSLSRALLRLAPSASGQIVFEGTDVASLKESALKPLRRGMQMVFQDPHASLNPRRTVGEIMHATLRAQGVENQLARTGRILELLDRVRLPSASLERYPHEFSGGQRQRIAIARALLPRPSLVICDEPASSLDLPVRAQVLNLLADLKQELGLSYLFISHDLAVVRYMADRVLVMRKGEIVEQGDHREIWARPRHSYTQSLIDAAPGFAFGEAGVVSVL